MSDLIFQQEALVAADNYDLSLRFRYKDGTLRMNVQSTTLENLMKGLGKRAAIEGGHEDGPHITKHLWTRYNGVCLYNLPSPLKLKNKVELNAPAHGPFTNGGWPNFTWLRMVGLGTGLVLTWNLPWSEEQEETYIATVKLVMVDIADQYLREKDTVYRIKFIEGPYR